MPVLYDYPVYINIWPTSLFLLRLDHPNEDVSNTVTKLLL